MLRSLKYPRWSTLCGSRSISSGAIDPKAPFTTRLKSRSLISLSGKDAAPLLQGLITNDIHSLDTSSGTGSSSCYAMMLNNQGRILYDLLIHRRYASEYLLECDSLIRDQIFGHVRKFKLRKDVQIAVLDSASIFVSSFSPELSPSDQLVSVKDPRLNALGYRIYGLDKIQLPSEIASASDQENDYRRLRYELGIAEGSREMPVGECLPFDYNLDYLNGVHFHKGCYLGQELTARTYHTGVVRKRLMPVVLTDVQGKDDESFPRGSTIVSEQEKSIGKLVAHIGSTGIAVLRISEALAAKSIHVRTESKSSIVEVRKPEWWPDP